MGPRRAALVCFPGQGEEESERRTVDKSERGEGRLVAQGRRQLSCGTMVFPLWDARLPQRWWWCNMASGLHICTLHSALCTLHAAGIRYGRGRVVDDTYTSATCRQPSAAAFSVFCACARRRLACPKRQQSGCSRSHSQSLPQTNPAECSLPSTPRPMPAHMHMHTPTAGGTGRASARCCC